jgi:hypothetical protein
MTSTNYEQLFDEIHDALQEDIAAIDTSSTSNTAQTMLTKILEAPVPEYPIDAKSLRPKATRLQVRIRLAIAAASVAAVMVTSVLVSGVFTPSVSSAAVFLGKVTLIADQQPLIPSLSAGQYYYERNVITYNQMCQLQKRSYSSSILQSGEYFPNEPVVTYVSTQTRQSWAQNDNAGAVVATPTGGNWPSAAAKAQWVSLGSPDLSACGAPSIPFQTIPAASAAYPTLPNSGVGYLPKDPSTLATLLSEGRVDDVGNLLVNGFCSTQSPCSTATQFDVAVNLLSQPEGPSLLGPVLYQILAKLPGVEKIGSMTDALGRTGTAIEDPMTGVVFVIDPSNGTLLQQETLTTPANSGGPRTTGSWLYSVTYGPLQITNGLGSQPSS